MIALMLFVLMLTSPTTSDKQECRKDRCPKNQRWVQCELGFCAPKTCDDLGNPIACPDIAGPCPGGCLCIDKYLKNSQGVCIPQENCPSCGGDRNATSGDGLHCGNLCSNYFEKKCKFDACRKQTPYYNACSCKKGYVFNDITGQCIAPKDCPKPCNGDYYAEYQSCPSACQPTCGNPEKPEVCVDSCNDNKCVCREGYILTEPNGKCVKLGECPDDTGCNGDPHAYATSCPNPCPTTCDQLINGTESIMCLASCKPVGCACKESYVISKEQGKCISASECINSQGGCGGDLNANKSPCASACPLTCEILNKEEEQMMCPAVCLVDGCVCKPSFVYSKKQGKCISDIECSNSAQASYKK